MKKLTDRVAVITGAGSGIGRALARELTRHGTHLALSDIDEKGLAETAELCRAAGARRIETSILDVADEEAVYEYAEKVERDFHRVNLVFNNAGVAIKSRIMETSTEDFRWLMDINFWGVVYGTRAFLPKLISHGEGHMINISSIFGLIGIPKQGAYNASKFAVTGFSEALNQELKIDRLPVRVSSVHPGFIATAIGRSARLSPGEDPDQTADAFNRMARTTPERAARVIIRGVRRNKTRILVGPDALGVEFLHRIFGIHYHYITRPIARRFLYSDE